MLLLSDPINIVQQKHDKKLVLNISKSFYSHQFFCYWDFIAFLYTCFESFVAVKVAEVMVAITLKIE